MDFSIFYAWQSDSPKKCNLNFIEDAIKKAIAKINKQVDLELSPRLDRDTKDVAGTPAIADTILEKIKASGMVVADMTLVGTSDCEITLWQVIKAWIMNRLSSKTTLQQIMTGKRLSNSNAAIEAGNAADALGWDRVILVMNTFYGPPEKLPFDIVHRRFPIRYHLAPDATEEERKKVKQELVDVLVTAITAAADAEHVQAENAIKRLDIDCLMIISILRNAQWFRDIAQAPEMLQEVGHLIDVPRFHVAIQRLLDLGLIFTHVQSPNYAYHWTTSGKLVIKKLDIQHVLTQPPIDPAQASS